MSPRNYYAVLGVSRSATSRQVRSAYRALARQFHPDLRPDDKLASEKFREVQEAYDVLGDPRKRKAYDYYGPGFGERIPARAGGVRSPASSVRVPPDFSQSIPRPSHRANPSLWGTRSSRGAGYYLGRLAVGGVFVIGTIIYLQVPSSGTREFRRTREALRHIKSVKLRGSYYSAAGDRLEEVSCPASDRVTEHIQPAVTGQPFSLTLVTLTIAGDAYRYNDRSNSWTHDRMGSSLAPRICSRLSLGDDAEPYFSFGRWLSGTYAIEKGDLRTIPDGTCREWQVRDTTPMPFRVGPATNSVCLDVKTHLPMFEGAPNTLGEVRFYDWNVPIDMQPPAATQ